MSFQMLIYSRPKILTYNCVTFRLYRFRYLSQNDGLEALCGSFFLLLLLLA